MATTDPVVLPPRECTGGSRTCTCVIGKKDGHLGCNQHKGKALTAPDGILPGTRTTCCFCLEAHTNGQKRRRAAQREHERAYSEDERSVRRRLDVSAPRVFSIAPRKPIDLYLFDQAFLAEVELRYIQWGRVSSKHRWSGAATAQESNAHWDGLFDRLANSRTIGGRINEARISFVDTSRRPDAKADMRRIYDAMHRDYEANYKDFKTTRMVDGRVRRSIDWGAYLA